MKRMNVLAAAVVMLFMVSASNIFAQQKLYELETASEIPTTESKALERFGSCWCNAGTALLEAEWIRNGNEAIDLSELDFIRNAYLLKGEAYLESDGKIRVDETGIPCNVVMLMEKYGMAPSEAFMKSPDYSADTRSGEMDAIMRGTLRTVQIKENGNFTERWQNVYDGALTRFLGDVKLEFSFKGTDYTPKTFAEQSGLKATDYIMLGSDTENPVNQPFVMELKSNWNKDKCYNVAMNDLSSTISDAIDEGYTVLWYGNTGKDFIYEAENVAIVPAVKMSENTEADQERTTPFPEATVSVQSRQDQLIDFDEKEAEYMLIYGISKDKEGKEYFKAKYVCEDGNKGLNLSREFVNLNTIYLMLNKNALSSGLQNKLGI